MPLLFLRNPRQAVLAHWFPQICSSRLTHIFTLRQFAVCRSSPALRSCLEWVHIGRLTSECTSMSEVMETACYLCKAAGVCKSLYLWRDCPCPSQIPEVSRLDAATHVLEKKPCFWGQALDYTLTWQSRFWILRYWPRGVFFSSFFFLFPLATGDGI